MKVCTKCGETKPLEAFARRSTGRPQSWCRACTSRNNQGWKSRHPDRVRDHTLRRRYGVGSAEYERLYEAQGGRCAICGTDKPGGARKHFCVDHDHATGAVRGLLCSDCNMALGWYEKVAGAAARYLDAFKGVVKS